MTASDDEVAKARLPYDHGELETRWQARWDADATYEVDTALASAPGEARARFYNLVEFPYPSGEGLHVGHAMTYCGADVVGRYERMCGKTVFQPMAFDAFGINAENYALRERVHPALLMERTTAYFRHSQLSRLGCAWNWREAVTTCNPGYYRWTQWLFLRLLEAGLAYRAEAPVTWCPACQTVLAHEQLEAGRCERCGTTVVERQMSQWFLRITAYADALVDGLEQLDWPQRAKRAQREWIGRSRGVEIDFGDLTVFTTRPETVMGVRFLAVAVDHPLAAGHRGAAVASYVEAARRRAASGEPPGAKTAVPLGTYRPHPLSGERLPVYVADYVLAGYGTGAVMGVPARDDRDRALAEALGIDPGAAPLIDPQGIGRPATRYRLRDWLISRQRYWGPPIPVVHCPVCGAVPVPDSQLPVLLPEVDAEAVRPTGTGSSPLAAIESFVRTACPRCGAAARRDTDVSDTFFDSCWYYLRYPSADLEDRPFDAVRTAAWLPVDLYAGGPEHVARHHLYARFVTKALCDLGLVPFDEPFPRIALHGFITRGGSKLAKSKGNIIRPEHYVDRHGGDVLRLHLLFCCRWEDGGEWRDEGITGVERFLSRLWRLVHAAGPAGGGGVPECAFAAGERVESAIRSTRFNVGVAALMELTNDLGPRPARESLGVLVQLLAPFAPYVAEELWAALGLAAGSVHLQPWPSRPAPSNPPGAAPRRGAARVVQIAVQVDGKLRAVVEVPGESTADAIEGAARASGTVAARLEGRRVERVIHVDGRAVNFVTSPG